MQQEMERRQTELSAAQGTIRKLEEQLKETQVAKDELVAQQQELHEMMIRFKIERCIFWSKSVNIQCELDRCMRC